MPQHGGITCLTGGQTDHQRTATAVDELMDLGAQATAGSTQGMIQRLRLTGQILVIRLSPLCGTRLAARRGTCWWRADGHG